ncbi:alginate export family protein [Aquisediminimonas sediminicola]|uniref:alginate export family protein n=1 Tax=Alteraquisediminimonas sediminicola TaxID=2676787 RepID=UPI001FE4E0D6|nr:alginate export family protein [Aquisediminimonas sediminicola]
MTKTMMTTALFASAAALVTPAFADEIKLKPLVDARLRYEQVDQDGLAPKAEAVTARARLGVEASNSVFSALVEAEGTLALDEKYNSGLNGKTAYPLIADPENVELNRAQVQFKGLAKTVVTMGRQRINLDDQRFVGAVGWRDNEQTFDAVRVEYMGIKNLKADLTYSWSARTIWGMDGGNRYGAARQQAISGDNVFANVTWKQPLGTVTGFAYLVDQDETKVSGFRNSSQTYGARYAGNFPLTKLAKLSAVVSYAYQRDYKANPNDYAADYWLGELAVEAKGFKLTGGYELLGAGKGTSAGQTLASFQTPLATLHKFNGWADKFLTTPANGLQDMYATLGYTRPKVGPFDAISASVTYHDYDSDRFNIDDGSEINLVLAAKLRKFAFTLKYADYNAKAFATDTSKLWASVEWAY